MPSITLSDAAPLNWVSGLRRGLLAIVAAVVERSPKKGPAPKGPLTLQGTMMMKATANPRDE